MGGDGEEIVIGVWSTFSHFHLCLIMLDGRHKPVSPLSLHHQHPQP